MTREQANEKARAWLLENHYYQFGGIAEEEEINSLATLLLATEAAVLEEAAGIARATDYGPNSSPLDGIERRMRELIASKLREQAVQRRQA